jgi:hypothetical protein
MLVEEGPWRRDDDKGEGGAGEANPQGKRYVLGDVANEKCNSLILCELILPRD